MGTDNKIDLNIKPVLKSNLITLGFRYPYLQN